MEKTVRVLALGAHPDDCDIKVGGCAVLWARMGHCVQFVSVTNGDAGHHEMGGGPLAQRRAGEIAGIRYIALDNHDGELMPTLEARKRLIRLIRRFNPDLIFTRRPPDAPTLSETPRSVEPPSPPPDAEKDMAAAGLGDAPALCVGVQREKPLTHPGH